MAEIPASYLPRFRIHLGRPVKIYSQGLGSRVLFIIRLLIWVAVVAVCINLLRTWLFVTPPDDLFSVVIAGAVIYFVSGLVAPALYTYMRQWNDMAVEYTEGIAYQRGSEWRAMRWDAIQQVTRRKSSAPWGFLQDESGLGCLLLLVALVVGRTGQYTIIGKDGGEIRIGGTLEDVEQLVEKIASAIPSTPKGGGSKPGS